MWLIIAKYFKQDDALRPIQRKSEKGVKRGSIPYWMKSIESTPDLVLRYQLRTKELEETLQADLRVLREINQVSLPKNYKKIRLIYSYNVLKIIGYFCFE